MPVDIKDIKSRSVVKSSSPFEQWEAEKKSTAKTEIKSGKEKVTPNPFDQYFKKKSGTEDIGDGSEVVSIEEQKPKINRIPTNDFSSTLETQIYGGEIKTPDGTPLKLKNTNPFGNVEVVKSLQKRIDDNALTSNDIFNISQATGKSPEVINAYIKRGKMYGGAVENLEKEKKTTDQLSSTIRDFDANYGGGTFGKQYYPQDILSSAEKTTQFLRDYEIKTGEKNANIVAKEYAKKQAEAEKLGYYDTDQQALMQIANDKTKEEVLALRGQFDLHKRLLDDHIVNLTIAEDKKAGVPKDQTLIKIAQRTNPKGFQESTKGLKPNKDVPDNIVNKLGSLAGDAYDAMVGVKDKEELLNSVKGEAELRYNDGIGKLAIDKISQGVIAQDNNLIQQGRAELDGIDNDVIYKYPSLVKQEIARRVSEEFARETGQAEDSETRNVVGKIFGGDINSYRKIMKEMGYLDNPKTRDIAESMLDNPRHYFTDASYLGSVIPSAVRPFKELLSSIGDITGFRNELDILSEKKKEELFPNELDNLKSSTKTVRNILNTTANLTGMAVIASTTEGLGIEAGIAKETAKSLGAYTSFGLPSYDAALKDSYNFLDNDAARTMYATITAVANAEGGRLLDLGKIVRIPGVSDNWAKMAQGLTDKSLTKTGLKQLLGETENKYVDFAVKYGKNVTKGAATMAYFNISNNITKLSFGDPNVKFDEILPDAGHAFVDGVLGMSIMGAFGAVADMRNEKNTSYKGFIYNMALNHDASADIFKQGLKEGRYTEEEYNQKMQILNTAKAAKGALDLAQIDNNTLLNENQKSVYVANKTAIGVLNKQLGGLKPEQEERKSELKGQIKNLEQQNADVMKGLQFTPTLEALYDLFEAEKEYNQALEEVNSKENEGDYLKVEAAKNKYDELVNQYFNNEKVKSSEDKNAKNEDGKTEETKDSKGETKVVLDTEIKPTFDKTKELLSEEQINIAQPIIDRVNNAENINEKEINAAQDVLYEALDKNPDAAHLIEPLILKLQDYEFTTKTESRTVTEKVPVEATGKTSERNPVSKALDQWEGNRATITGEDGKEVTGLLKSEDGKYYLFNEQGEKVASIGEKQITDRDITLPDKEQVPIPIQVDAEGNVKSITLQLNKVDKENGGIVPDKQITVNFKDPEKALDYAIQLRAEQIGVIPDAYLDKAIQEIQKEIQVEVPAKDISSQSKSENDGNKKSSSQNSQESGEKGSNKSSQESGKESDVKNPVPNPLNKGTASESGAAPSIEQLYETQKDNPALAGMIPEQGIKFIAEQAQNISHTGEKLTGDAYESTVNAYGKELVDAAIKKHPEKDLLSGGEPPKTESSKTNSENEPEKRSFTKQVLDKEEILPEAKAKIAENIDYVKQTNAMSIAEANEIIDKIGLDEANTLVTGNNEVQPAVRATMGQVLILKYNDLAAKEKEGTPERNALVDKTVDIANYVSDKLATQPGQMIQALSLFGRLSPEGQLRAAIKDQKKQAEPKKSKAKSDVDELGNKLKKINEETADEVSKSPKVKKATEKTDSDLKVKSKDKIKKAQEKRAKLFEKYKNNKGGGLTLTSGGLTKEGLEYVGELAKTYIDEGIGEIGLVIDKVLEDLKRITGKDLSDEVTKGVHDVVGSKSDEVVNKNAVQGIKELESSIGKIIRDHYTVKDVEKKSLVDKFVKDLGMDNDTAKELAKEIQSEFDKIATRKKQDLLTAEKKRFDRIQAGLQGSKKENDLQSQMIKYSNLGAFDNSSLLDMIGEKLGTGQLTPEQGQRIKELARKIQDAPEGSPKRAATERLLSYRANLKGTEWGEVAQGVWYAQVLSGYATHIRNIVSTFFNTMAFFGVESARNPKAIPYLMLGLGKGIGRIGAVEAAHTLKTGQTPIHISKIETPDVLERMNFKGGFLNPVNYLKYVGRLMKAEDVLLFQGLKEMRATQLALREANIQGFKPTWNPWSKQNKRVNDKVNELLLNTEDRKEKAIAQTKTENLKGIEAKRRMYELMEASRPIQMTEDAYGFAAKGTFNHETEGTLGAVSDAISGFLDNSLEVGGAKPLRFLVPFTRIITNVANNTLDFSPVGLVRAAAGRRGLLATEKSGKRIEMTKEERQQTLVKASMGIAAMGTLYALAANNVVQVSGAGPSDIKKKMQLMEEGWMPYSIKVGNKWISYKLTPFVFAFGLIGSIRDHQTYDKEDDQNLWDRSTLVAWDGIKNIGDMTWVSSAAPLMGAMASNNPGEATDILSRTVSRTLKSFVPVVGSNLYAQLAQRIESWFNVPQKQVNGFLQSLIQDVPIARNLLNDKINVLGDPIVRDPDVLWSTEKSDPVWKYLADKKGWAAPVNKNTIIIFDTDTQKDRPVSEDEYYEFSKLRGQKIKHELNNLLQFGATVDGEQKTATQIPSAQLNKLLRSIATQATKETKKELFEPKSKTEKQNVEINEY